MMGNLPDVAGLIPYLSSFSLFADLSQDLLQEVAGNLRYQELCAGEALLRQGEPGDALYLIVDGCFEARLEHGPGAPRVLGTAGRGAVVGEMAVISGDPRSCSMYAVRESSALRLSQADFLRILGHHPQQMFRLAAQIVRRAATPMQQRPPATIALLPLSPGVDLDGFAPVLTAELARLRRARLIQRAEAERRFGAAALRGDSVLRDHHLLQWLAEEEREHELVVYQAGPSGPAATGAEAADGWTRRCLAQADLVLLVADPADPGYPRPAEQALLWQGRPVTEAPVELLLLHRSHGRAPQGTRRFLTPRPRVRLHHHVAQDSPADVRRLARLLTGRGVLLVLSGGGARALAHIGVLRALEEVGVPVDCVGGASMGGFLGALRALEWDADRIHSTSRRLVNDRLKDLTLPLLSLIRGERGTRLAQTLCGDRCIEDLWINYFAMSADLCSGEEVVHRQGPLWQAIRATVSIPGFVPPVVDGGRCLVDGGVLNNLPTDVMARLCNGLVVASDATQDRAFEQPPPLPLNVPGWRMLVRRANPFADPDMHIGDVVMRSAEIASARIGRGVAEKAAVALTLRPPVHGFRLLDFRPIDTIVQVAYEDARERVGWWWKAYPRL